MISVSEALKTVLKCLKPVDEETISLSNALGRVLSQDVSARLTHPPDDISAMDGYAVIASDTLSNPLTLKQIGTSQAGYGFDEHVSSGETVRIFTGARVPEGADAIIIQESVDVLGDLVALGEQVPKGTFIRRAGLDFTEGDIIGIAGQRLTARDVGLLAAANISQVPVHKKPRIAFLATGDELVMPGETIGRDQIISSNSIAMDAYIRVFGGEPVNLGIARDNKESLMRSLASLNDVDMLVTMGGASVGDFDLVHRALGEVGLELGFYKVAMRPGKPLLFGHFKGVPMLGLPGNPVSTSVTALLFLRPSIGLLSGCNERSIIFRWARLGKSLTVNDQRQEYLRASLEYDSHGELIVTPFAEQDSSMMQLLAHADCLIIRAPYADPIDSGSKVEIISFGDDLQQY